MKKLLTIGMATYDDYDGVYFTLQALKMYHRLAKEAEIIVVDNNPDGPCGKPVEGLVTNWVKGRYIPYKARKSTAVRNEIFRNATGKYCISMDCHVLFMPNALENLLDYYAVNSNCKDIVHGPLIYDDLKSPSTHFKPGWGASMYGKWDTDHEALNKGEPFEIPMQGLGVFSCETSNWRGFNKHFRGFGGEEGYIHEKFRQTGGKAICVPGFQWVHRFARPNGVKYPLFLEDRVWNYFVGWLEITQDENHPMVQDIYNYFKEKLPKENLDNLFSEAKKKILI
jgi:glycosyltransferase involved in cell wall biosynthesis